MYILYDFKGVLIHIMKQLLLIREYTLAIFIVINKCLPSLIFLFVCLEGSLKHRFPFIWQCGVFCFPCSLCLMSHSKFLAIEWKSYSRDPKQIIFCALLWNWKTCEGDDTVSREMSGEISPFQCSSMFPSIIHFFTSAVT